MLHFVIFLNIPGGDFLFRYILEEEVDGTFTLKTLFSLLWTDFGKKQELGGGRGPLDAHALFRQYCLPCKNLLTTYFREEL